ncbi:endonuclease-reverse transcriptase [Elysia marginata]|uniref:Endonuclease-reverse transcriptase n=1 Tax=Elysia marginata TaxID=1093978 RepID=A0AAV4EP50_9GAST|nr:endonuclease-reverse transcriptase [Elysia marginata]
MRTNENNFSKNRSRDAYNIIKSLTKRFQPKSVVIKDENGNVLTESRQILDRWKRYSKNMFSNTSEPKQTAVDNESYTDTELEPLRSEVEWAINSLKDGKSPGCDEITAEMLKTSGEAGITYYHKICKENMEDRGMARRMETSSVYYIT